MRDDLSFMPSCCYNVWAEIQCDMQRAIDLGFVCSVCLSIFCEVNHHQNIVMTLQDIALDTCPSLHALWHAWACAWQLIELWPWNVDR